jgi:hypothetical protein
MNDDWRFAAAYNAALQAAAAALKATGYEAPKAGGAHHYTIESLRLTIGDDGTVVDQLQMFRAKRGGGIYEETDIASEQDIKTLRQLAQHVFDEVRNYIATNLPNLAPAEPAKPSPPSRRGS